MLPQKLQTAFLFGILLCFFMSVQTNAKNIFIGDRQVAEMQKDISGIQTEENNSDIHADENGIWITDANADSAWFEDTALSEIKDYTAEDNNHIVIIPASSDSNSTEQASAYIDILNQYLEELSNNNKIYITSANPLADTTAKNQFNEHIKNNLPDNITFIDTATPLINKGYNIKNDNTYDQATNKKIFNTIKNSLIRKKFENGILIEEEEEDEDWMKNVTFTVAFNPNGGEGDITAQTVQFNQTIDHFPQLIKEGYEIDHWEASDGTVVTEETPIINDMTLIAIWKPSLNTPVTITRNIETLDGKIVKYDDYIAYGTTDHYASITPKKLDGFETPKEKIVFIKSDGSTKEEFTYKRNSYKITLNIQKGVISRQKKFVYKYEAPVELQLESKDFYDPYTIKGKVTESQFKMPAENITLTVSAKPTEYKIRYKGSGLYTKNLRQTYNLNDVPFQLEKPSTSPFVIFKKWTYDKKEITEIHDMSHTDINITGKTVPSPFILIFPILIGILCAAWYFFHKTTTTSKHKHERSLF